MAKRFRRVTVHFEEEPFIVIERSNDLRMLLSDCVRGNLYWVSEHHFPMLARFFCKGWVRSAWFYRRRKDSIMFVM